MLVCNTVIYRLWRKPQFFPSAWKQSNIPSKWATCCGAAPVSISCCNQNPNFIKGLMFIKMSVSPTLWEKTDFSLIKGYIPVLSSLEWRTDSIKMCVCTLLAHHRLSVQDTAVFSAVKRALSQTEM